MKKVTRLHPERERVGKLHASIIGTRTDASREGMSVLVDVRVESNVPTFDRIGHGRTMRGRDAVLDLELKLPMTSTREELAKALEQFAKALRDPKLGEEESPFASV